jgi:hypothetical protein
MSGKETSLKQLIQGMIPRETDLLQGTVTSVSPLAIQISNDSKLVIGKTITVVPKHLTNYTVNATVADTYGQRNATITVHNALAVGDRVHVLALQNGKKFYVLDKV